MAKRIYFESAEAGSPIEGVAVPALNRVTLARFAAAANDYNALHLDDKVAKASGKTSVYAPSTLVMGYIGKMVQQGLAGCAIRRYGLRVMKLLWPGDVLTCRGAIVDARKENGEFLIDMDVWADNQRGETVAKGRVLAVAPKAEGADLTKASAKIGLVYPPTAPKAGGTRRKATPKKKTTSRKKTKS